MKVAILAAFPVHLLPGFESQAPSGHYATWLPQLARNFKSLMRPDDEIHWVVMTKGIKEMTVVEHHNQHFHLLPRFKLSLSIMTYFCMERRQISKLLGELEPDVVHGWGTEDVYGLSQADWGKSSLLSMQGMLAHYWRISKGGLLARMMAFYEPRTIRRSSRLTSESPWGRDRIHEIAPTMPVDLVEYGAAKPFFTIDRKLSMSPTFLYVGSLCYRKGTDVLAQVFSDTRLAGAKLLVVGDGDVGMRARLEACGSSVEFIGRIGPEKVMELLSLSWALIHPARADTSPNSVKEARVAGLAIITTREGGQAQYVEDGKSGLFFDIKDQEQLVEAILKVSEDRSAAEEMGKFNLTAYQEMLEPSRTAEEFIKIYRDMIKNS